MHARKPEERSLIPRVASIGTRSDYEHVLHEREYLGRQALAVRDLSTRGPDGYQAIPPAPSSHASTLANATVSKLQNTSMSVEVIDSHWKRSVV